MSWISLSILSALFLGVYDLLKKSAVQGNAVLPVLFYGVVAGASVWTPFLIWSTISPQTIPLEFLRIPPLSGKEHLLLVAKSVLVAGSWLLGYFALKHLPLSTAGPIRSTGPLWTIIIAVVFMAEAPSRLQWIGVVIILGSFYAFSLIGKREGIHFYRNKWVCFMLGATILGACSSIYDKFLLQQTRLAPATVQAWFSVYLVAALFPFFVGWKKGIWTTGNFHWRWSIPLIGLALLAADIFYFTAVQKTDALISVISPLRRMSTLITFFGGVIWFNERSNLGWKIVCVLGMLFGVVLLNFKK